MNASAYAPRVGMPARAPVRRVPLVRPLRLATGSAAIALRVAESALEVSGSRTMDRLVRSRAWVVIIGVGLIGIVAMQVSLLKLNAGIGRAVETVATLERSNASLKAEVSRLSSGDRIQTLAGQQGFLMPEPADVTYLRAGDKRADALRAARRMGGADPAIAGPAGAVTTPQLSDALTGATGATAAPGVPAPPATATDPSVTQATAPAPANPSAAPPTTATQPTNPSNPSNPSAATAQATTGPTSSAPSSNGTTAAGTPAPAAPQTTSAGGVTLP